MTKYNVKILVCALVLVLCAVFLCVPAFASAEGFYYDFSQTPPPTIPPTAEPSSAPENPNHGSVGGSILAVLLTAVILIGGVYYYVRTKRKAPSNVKGGSDLDDYDYGQEDDEDYAFYEERSHDEENE